MNDHPVPGYTRITVWFLCVLAAWHVHVARGYTWAHFRVAPNGSKAPPTSIQCARTHMALQSGAARLRDDGTACEGLPVTWLQSPTYDRDFVYLQKASTVTTMDPKLLMSANATLLNIPGFLQEQSVMEIVLSSHKFNSSFYISLIVDESGLDHVMKIHVRGKQEPPYTVVAHTKNLIDKDPMNGTFPFTPTDGTYTVKIEIQSGNIKTSVNSAPWFDFSTAQRLSPITARMVGIQTGKFFKSLYLERFVFYNA